LTDAVIKAASSIEPSAFTPDEWKSENSLIADYAKNGFLVA
jgi:hypothetical protein